MLKPAQLYKDELNKKYIETWYNPKYLYYHTDEHKELNIPDNDYNERHFD